MSNMEALVWRAAKGSEKTSLNQKSHDLLWIPTRLPATKPPTMCAQASSLPRIYQRRQGRTENKLWLLGGSEGKVCLKKGWSITEKAYTLDTTALVAVWVAATAPNVIRERSRKMREREREDERERGWERERMIRRIAMCVNMRECVYVCELHSGRTKDKGKLRNIGSRVAENR